MYVVEYFYHFEGVWRVLQSCKTLSEAHAIADRLQQEFYPTYKKMYRVSSAFRPTAA